MPRLPERARKFLKKSKHFFLGHESVPFGSRIAKKPGSISYEVRKRIPREGDRTSSGSRILGTYLRYQRKGNTIVVYDSAGMPRAKYTKEGSRIKSAKRESSRA